MNTPSFNLTFLELAAILEEERIEEGQRIYKAIKEKANFRGWHTWDIPSREPYIDINESVLKEICGIEEDEDTDE